MSAGDFQLFLCHVNTDYPSGFTNQAGTDIYIAARTATHIEYGAAFNRNRDGRTAPVEPFHNLSVNIHEDMLYMLRRGRNGAAGGTAATRCCACVRRRRGPAPAPRATRPRPPAGRRPPGARGGMQAGRTLRPGKVPGHNQVAGAGKPMIGFVVQRHGCFFFPEGGLLL